jgi:FAD/FMN-containing dehydrogenase
LDESADDDSSNRIWHAGVGDGRIRVVDRAHMGHEAIGRLKSIRDRLRRLGGNLIIEQAPAELKSRVGTWGTFGAAAGIMQKVKQQLDPNGILSPERFGFETP